jgi:ABC-type uncharacterized transport system permease subunit
MTRQVRNPENGVASQLYALRAFDTPLEVLHEWIEENVLILTGNAQVYQTIEHVEERLEVQHEIMRMVQDGELDKELNPIVGNSDDHNEEAVHVQY